MVEVALELLSVTELFFTEVEVQSPEFDFPSNDVFDTALSVKRVEASSAEGILKYFEVCFEFVPHLILRDRFLGDIRI